MGNNAVSVKTGITRHLVEKTFPKIPAWPTFAATRVDSRQLHVTDTGSTACDRILHNPCMYAAHLPSLCAQKTRYGGWRQCKPQKLFQGNNHNKPNLILQYSILIVLSNTFFGRQLERATPAPPSPDAAWTMDNVRYITVLSGYVLVSP